MSQCTVCSHQRVREINLDLLMHRQRKLIAKQFKVSVFSLSTHARKHIPFRPPRLGKPVTPQEKLESLQFELQRLQLLAECDIRFNANEALKVFAARRTLLELELRAAGFLDATHQKLLHQAKQPLMGEHRVIFENGRARTVAVEVPEGSGGEAE